MGQFLLQKIANCTIFALYSICSAAIGFGVETGQTEKKITMPLADIQTTINAEKLYTDNQNGHWIVACGYAVANGHEPLIVSNDPAGAGMLP